MRSAAQKAMDEIIDPHGKNETKISEMLYPFIGLIVLISFGVWVWPSIERVGFDILALIFMALTGVTAGGVAFFLIFCLLLSIDRKLGPR